MIGLKGSIARLRAEAYAQPLMFDEQVQSDPAVVAQETKAYESRKRALNDSINSLQRSYALSMREIRWRSRWRRKDCCLRSSCCVCSASERHPGADC